MFGVPNSRICMLVILPRISHVAAALLVGGGHTNKPPTASMSESKQRVRVLRQVSGGVELSNSKRITVCVSL